MTSVVLLPDPSSPLSRESAAQAFADILDARVSAEAIGDFLLALSDRGETSIEIAEAARAACPPDPDRRPRWRDRRLRYGR